MSIEPSRIRPVGRCLRVFVTLVTALCLGGLSLRAAVQLPIRIFSSDATAVTSTSTVNVPPGANAPASLYLQIHNVRNGGMVSVAVNGSAFHDIHNHTVTFKEQDSRFGGIGGIHGTLNLFIPISASDAIKPSDVNVGGTNEIHIRLNGTDGNVSGIRVLKLNFRDSSDTDLIPPGEFTQEDPELWLPPLPDASDIQAGKYLWEGSTKPLVDNPVSGALINANCASCHFDDGSDLYYFNYSNESIIARSVFHGLSQTEGEQIASYIRSIGGPSPGNPWDPPFQPGPGLDDQPANEWLAGAGMEAVLDREQDMLAHLFPEGTSPGAIAEVIEHREMLNLRELPVAMQMPDWNTWLPRHAPEDLWDPDEPLYDNEPYRIYDEVRNEFETKGVAGLGASGDLWKTWNSLRNDTFNWLGGHRLDDKDLANDTLVSLARQPQFSREEMSYSIGRWIATKSMALVRAYDLEDKKDDLAVMRSDNPNFFHEPRNLDGGKSVTFMLAPHLAANNWDNFGFQSLEVGKFNSHQWYHLALIMNGTSKQKAPMNAPLDWDYHISHTNQSYQNGGLPVGVRYLVAHIKNQQSRDIGVGIVKGGYSQRTQFPNEWYSGNTDGTSENWLNLDSYEPGIWPKVFEALLYEWMDIIEGYDLSDPVLVERVAEPGGDKHIFEAGDNIALDYPGTGEFFGGVKKEFIHSAWRLIPLLDRSRPNALGHIDELLLNDFKELCAKIWPGPVDSPNDWDSRMAISASWYENFEDQVSDFGDGETVVAIKDPNWQNNTNITPRNGGGMYVGRYAGIQETETKVFDAAGVNVVLQPGTGKLRLNGRFAVEDVQTGTVKVRMSGTFDVGGTVDGPDLILNNDLTGRKFETYSFEIDVPVGATQLTDILFTIDRDAVGDGVTTAYFDNLHVRQVDTTPDVTAPAAPVMEKVNNSYKISWSYPDEMSEGVVSYNIYRWIDGDPASSVKLNTDYPFYSRDKKYQDLTTDYDVDYRFAVTAVDAAGNESALSNSVFESGRSDSDLDPPLAVTTAWARGGGAPINIHWFASLSHDVVGYHIYRRVSGDGAYVLQTPTPVTTLSYLDSTATSGTSYDWIVRAVDDNGNESADSPVVTLAPLSADFMAWQSAHFSEAEITAGDADPGFDLDQDGFSNEHEYFFGMDPRSRTHANQPAAGVSGNHPSMTFRRRVDSGGSIAYTVQASADLSQWTAVTRVDGGTEAGTYTLIHDSGDEGDGAKTMEIRYNQDFDVIPNGRLFFRVRAVE